MIKQYLNTKNSLTGIALLGSILCSCNSDQDKTTNNKTKENVAEEEKQQHPNILCLVTEDISPLLHCFGDSVAYTPNLDKLAEDGVRFTNVFSVSGVCAPSRAALITGMYPSGFGANCMRTNRKNLPNGIPPYEAVPPPEVKCYTEFLRASGYYCTNNKKEDYQFNAPVTAWDESSQHAHWRNRPDEMPFFAIFNFMTTHESQVWDRANDPVVISGEKVTVPPYYPDKEPVRREIARVYSNISVMDREVGEILQQLEDDGLMDETIIIFYSDHGGPLPRQKREIKDSGIKVPMIIRFPNKQHAGMVVDDLISFVDIPPTILSLAGIQIPEYIQGQAFWGDQKAEPRKYIFAARDRMDGQYDIRRAVRDKQFKYIRNYKPETGAYQDIQFRRKGLETMKQLLELRDAGQLNEDQMYWFRTTKQPEELYDITKDPHELHNLAQDTAYINHLKHLRKVHEQWMKDIDDKGSMTEKELVWSMWPNGEQPVTKKPTIVNENGDVAIKNNTNGASIAYQINGKGYTAKHWFLYTKPINLKSGDVLTVLAHRIGYKPSEQVSYTHSE